MAERPSFTFSPLRTWHIPSVLAVERKVFSNPWQESAFRVFLRPGIAFSRVALVDAGPVATSGSETGQGRSPGNERSEPSEAGAASGADRRREPARAGRYGRARRAARVAGYALGWCDGGGGELMNLAVDPPWQGRSLGAALLDWVLATCAARGAPELFLEVRSSNEQAQRLYRRHGFQICGRRGGYYDNPREDGLVYRAALQLRAGAIDSPQPPL